MSTTDIKTNETQLNDMIRQGKILDALDKFFDEKATFQEGNKPVRVGRAANHAFLSGFFKTLKAFNGATLHAQTISDNTSISEWTFDMAGPDGPILWNETMVRRWQNGKVISERYYTAS